MKDNLQNPWAGLASYPDPETSDVQLKFCGRDNESFDVAQLIDDNIFVTLYGKSGTGKTSLLNAGVFPRLRKEHYLPISIRLSMDALNTTFQECIEKKMQQIYEEKGRIQTIDVVPIPLDNQSIEYLWSLFACTRFVDSEGQVLFPVLVFDQFEEVFRDRRKEAEALLRQIHFMMDESHALSDRVINGVPYVYDFNFRFVVSIREDDLYRLEDSIDNNYLADMKRCRYRLRNLTEHGARAAILTPGEGLFHEKEKETVIQKLIGEGSIARNKEDQSISTNVLSLICNRIFVDFQKSGADHITPSLVDTFIKGNPFERFYNEATRGLSNKGKSYIEDHLVDSTGRRNSVSEHDFLRHVPNGALLLEGSRKILQRTSVSSDAQDFRIELIHDSFCEPLIELREKKKQLKRYFISLLSLSLALLFFTCVLSFYNIKSEKNKALENQSRFIAEKVYQLIKDGDSYSARLLALYVLQNNPYTIEAGAALLRASLENNAISSKACHEARISPDGSMIASISIDRRKIKILDTASFGVIKEWDGDESINHIYFCNDGKSIVSLSSEYTIKRLIEDETCDTLIGRKKKEERVLAISFSPDEKHFATLSADSTLRIMSFEEKLYSLKKKFYKQPTEIAYSPDGESIATVSGNSIRFWNSATLELENQIVIDSTLFIQNIHFNHNKQRLYFKTKDYVFGFNIGTKTFFLKEPCSRTYSISDDERFMATATYNTIRLLDLTTGEIIKELKEDGLIDMISFFPNSSPSHFLISSANSLKMFEVGSPRSTKTLHPYTNYIYRGWNFDFTPMNSLKLSRDGKYIVSSSYKSERGRFNSMHIWDTNEGTMIDSLYHDSWCGDMHLAISPNGTLIAFETKSGIKTYDKREKKQKSLRHAGKNLVFSDNNENLYFCSSDTVFKWNVSLEELSVVNVLPNSIIELCLTEKLLAAVPIVRIGNKGTIHKSINIWDVANKKPISALKTLEDLKCSAFSNDGSYFGIITFQDNIKLFDVKSGEIIIEKFIEDNPTCLSFSPDNRAIAVGKKNGTIDILDDSGSLIYRLNECSNGQINSISFTPSGNKIITAHNNGAIEIKHYFHIQELIDQTRERFKNRQLTPEERRKYYLE